METNTKEVRIDKNSILKMGGLGFMALPLATSNR